MTTTHDAQRAMKIFFKSELDIHDRKEWLSVTGSYDITTKVLWDTIRASEGVAGLGAAVSASADDHELGDPLWPIYQKLAETADKPHLTYSGWLRTIAQKLEREFFAAAPAQEPDTGLLEDCAMLLRRIDNLLREVRAQEQPVENSLCGAPLGSSGYLEVYCKEQKGHDNGKHEPSPQKGKP